MQLYTSKGSPYGRKVVVSLIETGLIEQVEIIETNPMQDETLPTLNPLAKVPTLLVGDTALPDSKIICDYIARISGERLLPTDGVERTRGMRLQALADGVLDAVDFIFIEQFREKVEGQTRWDMWVEIQSLKVNRGLAMLEGEVDGFLDPPQLGEIALGCCLTFLEDQGGAWFPDWREKHPKLAGWHDRVSQRDSFRQTVPPRDLLGG